MAAIRIQAGSPTTETESGVQATLVALVELQKVQLALREIEAQREQGPERLASLEAEFRAKEAEVGAAKHRYEQLRLEKAQFELDLKSLEEKRAKYQAQLMDVRTSKEYSAALREIDLTKAEISRSEDEVLARDEEMTALEKDVPEAEARIAEERAIYESTRAAVEAELAVVDQRLAEIQARRRVLGEKVPADIVANFDRVAHARGGLAVVKIVEPVCSACNVRLRIQMYTQIRRGETLITCDSCKRYLYFEEAQPAVVETSAGANDAGRTAGA
jgi:predicted  nucleic acid-binding Zn-ribbon protein